MICSIKSDVNPLDLRINRKYRDVRKVDPIITRAFKQLVADAQKAGEEQGWVGNLPKDARLKMTFFYTMPHRRADVDGPSKRAQDAVANGLGFNDNRVDIVTNIRAPVGEPGIVCIVETLSHHVPEPWEVDEDAEWTIGAGESWPTFVNKDTE